jgi:hypothetical protein
MLLDRNVERGVVVKQVYREGPVETSFPLVGYCTAHPGFEC